MAILGPKIYRFGLWHPDLVQANDIYKIFRIFMGNLNELCGFYHDPNVGVPICLGRVNLAYTRTMVKILKFLGGGQLQNIIDRCSVLRASPPHTCKHRFSLNLAA